MTPPPLFTEIFAWKGENYELSIYPDTNFSELENIQQVYGFVFNKKQEILLIKLPEGKWCLPGGGPEEYDKDWKETLKREILEEADVEIEDIKPVCYLTSKCLGNNKNCAKIGTMLRAVAKLKNIKEQTFDPAHGKINERIFVPTGKFIEYCDWGENGRIQLELALKKLGELK